MKKLILITGDLASGKTRFSKKLGSEYCIPVFDKDSVKEILGDTIGFSNREENRKLSEASRCIMALFLSKYLKSSSDLIMESNFRKEEIEKLSAMAESYGYKTLVLCLYGDIEVLHKRYVERISKEHRHSVHQSTTFDIFEDFKNYVESSRYELSDNAIMIDATDLKYQDDPVILGSIKNFLKN